MLAAELPKFDFNFAVDFCVDLLFFLLSKE